jgi:hypothetical protein
MGLRFVDFSTFSATSLLLVGFSLSQRYGRRVHSERDASLEATTLALLPAGDLKSRMYFIGRKKLIKRFFGYLLDLLIFFGISKIFKRYYVKI